MYAMGFKSLPHKIQIGQPIIIFISVQYKKCCSIILAILLKVDSIIKTLLIEHITFVNWMMISHLIVSRQIEVLEKKNVTQIVWIFQNHRFQLVIGLNTAKLAKDGMLTGLTLQITTQSLLSITIAQVQMEIKSHGVIQLIQM